MPNKTDTNRALEPRNPGGRPSKRTPRNRELILAQVRKGMPWQLACRAAGLSPRTLEAWCADDPTLWEDIDQAQAEATLELANDLNRLARKDPKVLLELLRLRCPEGYCPHSPPVPRAEPAMPTGAELLRQMDATLRAEALEEDRHTTEVTVHPLEHALPTQAAIPAPKPEAFAWNQRPDPGAETGPKRYGF